MRLYKRGDKVEANGNKEAIILDVYDVKNDLYDVRLWHGFRHVGDICLSGKELKPITESEA